MLRYSGFEGVESLRVREVRRQMDEMCIAQGNGVGGPPASYTSRSATLEKEEKEIEVLASTLGNISTTTESYPTHHHGPCHGISNKLARQEEELSAANETAYNENNEGGDNGGNGPEPPENQKMGLDKKRSLETDHDDDNEENGFIPLAISPPKLHRSLPLPFSTRGQRIFPWLIRRMTGDGGDEPKQHLEKAPAEYPITPCRPTPHTNSIGHASVKNQGVEMPMWRCRRYFTQDVAYSVQKSSRLAASAANGSGAWKHDKFEELYGEGERKERLSPISIAKRSLNLHQQRDRRHRADGGERHSHYSGRNGCRSHKPANDRCQTIHRASSPKPVEKRRRHVVENEKEQGREMTGEEKRARSK